MMDFLFFVKTLIMTIALVLLLQIRVGRSTLETHAMTWVQSSMVTSPLRQVAEGGAQMARDLTHTIAEKIHQNVFKSSPAKSTNEDRN